MIASTLFDLFIQWAPLLGLAAGVVFVWRSVARSARRAERDRIAAQQARATAWREAAMRREVETPRSRGATIEKLRRGKF